MKAIAIFTIILFLSGCVKLSERDDVRSGIKSADPVIVLIEQYKSEKEIYPSNIEELEAPESTIANLNRHGIQYKTYNENSDFGIAFGVSGLIITPWCGYGSFS